MQPPCPLITAPITIRECGSNRNLNLLAVDVERRILGEGRDLHAGCEQVLLKYGSNQAKLWGADWYPLTQTVGYYKSIINIRSKANNRSAEIQVPALREQVNQILQTFLGKVQWQ